MASKTDHDNNRTDIIDLLPEVYRSDVNRSLFDATFNKFLTKDDTVHVAGFVGKGNPAALVNRQLPEPTPHRQAHQLAPVMYTKNGTVDSVLTFKGFQQQLGLMGVDVANMDAWAATERFNWIPPVNLDMLINYADYFWRTTEGQTPAQHFTIENRCNKATSKLAAYQTILARRGSILDVVEFDFAANAMIIDGKHDDIFVKDFTFVTSGTNNINLADKTWHAVSSSYDNESNRTTIVVSPRMAINTPIDDINVLHTPPAATFDGQWWYRYSTNPSTPLSQLSVWTGSVWVATSQFVASHISLADQEAIYQSEVNCACESDIGGWDAKQWDDGQQSALVWNTGLMASIGFPTVSEWLIVNKRTSPFDLWYDTSLDQLKQRDEQNTEWVVVKERFSDVLAETAGQTRWDASVGCTPQRHTQWSLENRWVHKSELSTFVGAQRAQVPILEYSSQTEINEWTEVTHRWKYRSEPNFEFSEGDAQPHRFELEPIKSYVAHNVDGVWYVFLATERSSANRDIDYTNTFTKGYKFRIVDKNGYAQLYTVENSLFRQVDATDPDDLPQNRFVTVVRLQETDFTAPMVAGVYYERIPTPAPPPQPPPFVIHTLRNPSTEEWDEFGWSVAISGDRAVIGAPWFNSSGVDAVGVAYLFDVTTGEMLRTLTNPSPDHRDLFGSSVAISGDWVVVGAPGAGSDWQGAIYVFGAETGALRAQITNPILTSRWGEFGTSVAIGYKQGSDGLTYRGVAGAIYDDSASIFTPTGTVTNRLVAPPNAEWFGWSVATDGDLVVVGDRFSDHGGQEWADWAGATPGAVPGAVHVFDVNTGQLVRTLGPPTEERTGRTGLRTVSSLEFGYSVAIDGNHVVVGAPGSATQDHEDAGAVYVFDAATGNLIHKLNNPTPTTWGRFGHSVSVSGNLVAVSAPDNETEGKVGVVYIFDAISGILLRTWLTPLPPSSYSFSQFGQSVAISGTQGVVGSPWAIVDDMSSGVAVAFSNFLNPHTTPPPSSDLGDDQSGPHTRLEPIKTSQGDNWQGYHVHWVLDELNTTRRAVAPQMRNPYAKNDDLVGGESIALQTGMLYLFDTYQEFMPANDGVVNVALHDRYKYNPEQPGYYAVVGQNHLRVYVNGNRQYGTYKEMTGFFAATPDYTVVDNIGLPSNIARTQFLVVDSIQFDRPLKANDIVRIEPAPPSFFDLGLYAVPVRTVESDDVFETMVKAGVQPQFRSIVRYHKNEQVKNKINQYPLFNVYDIITGEVANTSPLFAFAEDTSMSVNPSTQRRIYTTDDGREYMFEQFLVDEKNGKLFAYRTLTDNEPEYWYSPLTQQLKRWDGAGWTTTILSTIATGLIAQRPVVSATEPPELLNNHTSVWVNPSNLTFVQRDAVNGLWNALGGVVIADADPTLETMWKTSATFEKHIPKYVDRNGREIEKGSAEGDWEVISQWENNPEHENHKTILLSQLITHLSTIVAQQTPIPGLTNRGIFTKTQKDYDYSVGGTIKEHNDAFDALISAVNLDDVSPVGVIEFAQKQYTANMVTVRDVYSNTVVDALIEWSGYNTNQIVAKIADRCIAEFINNNFIARVFGDTTAYDAGTNTGMPNWIATAPMFGLTNKHRPHYAREGNSVTMIHHDGHRTYFSITPAEQDRYARILVRQYNAAQPGMAVISSTPPTTPTYWYKPGANATLYKRDGTNWDAINFAEMLAAVYLAIEHRLYDASPAYPVPPFNFSVLTDTVASQQVYDDRLFSRFMNFVTQKNIVAPLTNTSYSITDPFTWNYAQCIVDLPPRAGIATTPRGCWQAVYQHWYGTPHPHLEPWVLQQYDHKPAWWDDEYAETNGTRRWKYNHTTKVGMWENIRRGTVPAGRYYPDGTISTGNPVVDGRRLPTYNYFSVNIMGEPAPGGYQPDALLPPYYDNTMIMLLNPTVRSVFRVFSTQIIAPDADYLFGQQGPSEWRWEVSSERVYDQSVVAFLMKPVEFFHSTFGNKFVVIGGLQVDATFKKVLSHKETIFHGDIYDNNKLYKATGLSQWYVNFNRYNGFDTNVNFRTQWTQWVPRQAYQTAGIIDTATLQVFNRHFDVTDRDYNVTLANSGVIKQMWADAFTVGLLSMPPAIVQVNNQAQWRFAVGTHAPALRTLNIYGTQQWPVMVDRDTDEFSAFSFDIDDVTASINTFEVRGDQTPFFLSGVQFAVAGSTTNDGIYTVVVSTFDSIRQTTRIRCAENVATSIRDGHIDIPDFAHNWVTGDIIVVSSNKPLPYPLVANSEYYVIRVDAKRFKIALTMNDASQGIAVDITSIPQGDVVVGKVKSTFSVFEGSAVDDVWLHLELNKDDVRTVTLPTTIVGMQNLINFIDGYVQHQIDAGLVYNNTNDFIEYDADTGQPVSWQVETERLIDWAYSLRRSRVEISDRYQFVVSNVADGTFRFTSSGPAWEKGKAIVLSTSGSLPEPLFANVPYYFAPVEGDSQLFRLAVNPRVDDPNSIVEITTAGGGIHSGSVQKSDQQFPTFDVNPMRNNLWVATPQGMLSNVLSGPHADIRVSQTLYDQYGRNLTADKIVVYRHDTISRISVRPEIANDVEHRFGLSDPYNYIHIGGAHLFVEGYEHVLMFNNYTVGNDLIFDPFLGLHIQRFELDYDKQQHYTLRPSIGGYYLTSDGFVRNIEGSVQDLRRYYDAYDLTEGTPAAAHARHTLGYNPGDGNMSYLDLLNVNAKSQFLFYRGMIQHKGSINSVMAYVNSKKFVDAKIDEFWAYQIGEFGDSRPKIYPRLKLFTADSTKADVRLKFTSPPDLDLNPIVDIQKGFETITMITGNRWVDYPQQREDVQSALFLDASISSMTKLFVSRSTGALASPNYVSQPPRNGFNEFDVWVNIHNNQPYYYKWSDDGWIEPASLTFSIREVDNVIYITLPTPADGVRVVARKTQQQGNLLTFTSTLMNEVAAANGYYRVNSEVIAFPSADILFISVDATTNSIVVDDDDIIKFMPGDKVLLSTTTKIHTVVSVDPLRKHVRFTEPITPLTATGIARQIGFTDLITIFTVNPSLNKISAPRIKDIKSHVHVQDIPLWHPAIGIHSPVASHNVDVVSSVDPAQYLNTLTTALSSQNPWLSPEVGTMWLDESALGYKPYYDSIIHPDIDSRLHQWGKQQDWSSVRVYQWVETTIAPDRWAQVADSQSGNLKIAKQNRVTGTPKMTLFKRTRARDIAVIDRFTRRITPTTRNTYENGDVVLFTEGSTALPEAIIAGQQYVVDDFRSVDGSFVIVDLEGQAVDTQFDGTDAQPNASISVTKPFTDSWVRQPVVRDRLYAATQASFVTDTVREPLLTLSAVDLVDGDVVDIYVNGELLTANKIVVNHAVDTTGSEYAMTKRDIIDVVRPIHLMTDAERRFNPDVEDDGTIDVQWFEMTEFSLVHKTIDRITYTYYYYWVEGITVERDIHDNASLSSAQVATEIAVIPTPYTVVQDPQDHDWARGFDVPPWDKAGYDQHLYTSYASNNQYLSTIFYRKAILSKIAPYIGEDDRYIVEFTRDLTLRGDIRAEHNEMYGKNKHQKWYMFRRSQIGAVPQELWIKMTEALMECRYDDFSTRVPSFEREHYDLVNGTETKYGLGQDQIFVKPEYARLTLVHYLQDPMNDFKPVDINTFFETYPATEGSFWADPHRVKEMCNYIYNTFDSKHTNAIWFDILSDALVTKSKYTGLMKTSWLALHGIRILDISGQFDDY